MHIHKAFKNERLLKALTGVSKAEFDELLPTFEQCLGQDLRARSAATERKFGGGAKGRLPDTASKLFFVLMYLKTYPTFDFLGFIVGFDKSRASRNTHFLLGTLEKALGRKLLLPKRQIRSMDEFLERFPEAKDLFVDGAERPVQRPRKHKQQRKLYSGKKKAHTKKTVIVTDEKKRIVLAIPTKSGRRHDKRLADKQALFERIPETVTLWTDTGFQGIQKQHHNSMVPTKGTKRNPLTYEQKQENKLMSSLRVVVEHAIGGAKRFKAFADIYRNKKACLEDRLMLLACGLWNLHLNHTA